MMCILFLVDSIFVIIVVVDLFIEWLIMVFGCILYVVIVVVNVICIVKMVG